jgi:hypothetical protein
MISVALVATWLAAGAGQVAAGLGGFAGASLPSSPAFTLGPRREAVEAASPVYRPEERAVSTWRVDTARALEPKLLAVAAALTGLERPVVTRCVKLNNPWCIKRARWTGEIGADDEGHVAFATVDKGADAAAALLRTYYVDYGRVSALDIVRRWAPAECRVGSPDGSALVLSVRGLGLTLRARFLAAQSGRRVAGPAVAPAPPPATGGRTAPAVRRVASPQRVRVSVVPSIRTPSYRVPDIAAGMGERPAAPRPQPSIAPPASRPALIRVGAPRPIPAPARLVSVPTRAARTAALPPRPTAARAIPTPRRLAPSAGTDPNRRPGAATGGRRAKRDRLRLRRRNPDPQLREPDQRERVSRAER